MTAAATDTIYALSSGSPPAAIAVIRISGPRADDVVAALAGRLPEPGRASLVTLRRRGEALDRALVLRFPGPASATGEDVAELHVHGGRAVVAAVLEALGELEGTREAQPGEFTRRALENGRIDLTEAEGLADLLMAETQSQRRAALSLAGGALGRRIDAWQRELLLLAAQVEAVLDFADEDDVGGELDAEWHRRLGGVVAQMEEMLAQPPAERLRDGIRVVIAGPPNAGKSTLLNYLAGRQAAITSEIAGTTRDVVEAPAALSGVPFLFVDTAGLRDSADPVEAIGVARARERIEDADIILWLGAPSDCPDPGRAITLQPKADLGLASNEAQLAVSALTGAGMGELLRLIEHRSRDLLPAPGEAALNARHRALVHEARLSLVEALETKDALLLAEALRQALNALDRVSGRAGVEDMLDALFAGFCIGK